MPTEPMDIRIGDVYTLRKPHPCGSYDWRVVRVGADIGMRCAKCDRKAMLPRPEFERRVKRLITRPAEATDEVVENESAV